MSSPKAAPGAAAPKAATASLVALLSPARAKASRRNGAKSRGPKTADGKTRSAQNALKHGLRAQKYVVLPEEDAAAFKALEAALLEELAPEGALQAVLAQRVVAAVWRLERAERIEAELFAREMHGPFGDGDLGLALIRDGNGARAFDTLLRYRGTTLAEFWRALRTLKALQAEQREAMVAEPAVVPAPRLLPEPSEVPIEPESRARPGNSAPPRVAKESAPPPAAIVPAVISCDRATARTKLPDELESRGNPGDFGRPGDPAEPKRGEPIRTEPAPPTVPTGIVERGSSALLAGTALVPPGRRSGP